MIPPQAPDLDDLLHALRAAGLPVGAREVLRLHRAFELGPVLDQNREPGEQLRRVLTAALVHSPAERDLFDPVFAAWSERFASFERRGRVEERRPERPGRKPRREPAKRRIARSRLASAAALVGLCALVAILIPQRPPPPVKTIEPPTAPAPPPTEDGFEILPPEPAPATFQAWVPRIEVVRGESFGFLWLRAALGVSLLAAAGALAWRYSRRRFLPTGLPAPALPGPRRLPLLPFAASGPELLDPEAARTMVWGVGRHQTEDLSPEIDLERTVDDTARDGGQPNLRYEPETRLRQVWLWIDGAVEDPSLRIYSEEIAASLGSAGLPVRLGGFDGSPAELRWDEGQRFHPEELEGHRQTALVAVLTDGEVLARHSRDNRAEGVRALLRALGTWERLAFVDFSDGRNPDLRPLLRRYGIPCVVPEAVPHFFGLGSTLAPERAGEDAGELHTWTAALALSPRAVDRAAAQELRRELGLEVSPWAYHRALATAGERLDWSAEERGRELSWLRGAEVEEKLVEGSVLERTLGFWEKRLDEEEEERRREEPEAWEERPAWRYLRMERAILKLWRQPTETSAELYELREELGDEIRERLQCLTPADCQEGGGVPLPWRLASQTHRTRYLLAQLGLGGVVKGKLRKPGRLGLALGTLAGLGLVLVAAGLLEGKRSKLPEIPFVRMEAGSFQMGSDDSDPHALDREKPAHGVTISGFWIGQREVTLAEMGSSSGPHEDVLPAANVTWFEARDFCKSLGQDFDLPTEAQWEYAARAGTRTRWSFEDDEASLGEYAWFSDNSGFEPHPVATLKPNSWGLHDMHGNVWEWTLDCFEDDAYAKRAAAAPIANPSVTEACLASSALRVLRGGSFNSVPGRLRSAYRVRFEPGFRVRGIGFRCVRRPGRQLDPSSP